MKQIYDTMMAGKAELIRGFDEALQPGTPKEPAPMPEDLPQRYEFEERQIAGVTVQIMHPRDHGSGIQIIYYHGGA